MISPGSMLSWTSTAGGQSQTGSLHWNYNGTLQQLAITDTANPADTQTCNYLYDDLARLSSAQCGTPWAQTFSYDVWGNLNQSGSVSSSSQGGTGNHAPGLSYDNDGNVTNDGFNTYTYSVYGRPATVPSAGVTGVYDAFSRLVEVQAVSGNTQLVYAPDGFKFAYMNGQTVKKYIAPLTAGLRTVYTAATPAAPAYWMHSDWLGSARLASTPSQGVYGDQAYSPFGYTYALGNRGLYYFTGQTRDLTSSIYDFLFRQYSQMQGRWMVPDPAGLGAVDITNPQTWNRYAYMANNPLSGRDPLGLYHCIGADDDYDNQDDCEGNGGFWALDPGDPGYSESQVNLPPLVYNPPPPDSSSYPDLGGTGGYGGNDSLGDAFQPGSWGYQVFQGSAQTWANASGTASFFAGATLGVVGGIGGAIAAPAIASTMWTAGTNLAARGFGWYYAFAGGSGVVLGEYQVAEGEMNYVQAARAIGANALNANRDVYNFFQSQGQWWTLNQAFLNASILRGQQFFLSTAPMGTGGFLQEMQYLQGRGINPFNLPWAWVP